MCLETQNKNASLGLAPVLLDWDSCLDWVPDRDALWDISMPATQAVGGDIDRHRIAIFSDLLRLRLLGRYGGVWMDADTIALPGAHVLGEAAQRYDFTASTFGQFAIMNGVMAARPGSPFLAALNDEIDRLLSQPAPDKVSWGAYGFRLFARMAHLANPATCLILPSGSVNQNPHDADRDDFAIGSQPPLTSALTLCVSLHNSTTTQEARDFTSDALRNRDCAFSQIYSDAMCAPRAYMPCLADYEALNLSDFALSLLSKRDHANSKIQRLKTNAATLKSKLLASNDRAKSLKMQLQNTREAVRKTFVDMNAQGHMPRRDVFAEIHRLHLWHSPESVSGCGSTLRQTETLRAKLRPFLDKHNIRTLLDIPCGDVNWIKEIDLSGITYIGADIVPKLVEDNRRKGLANMSFEVADIVTDPLPRADCVMVRDCFSHLPFDDIHRALANIAASGAQWALITHFADRTENTEIAAGDFHALNFCKAPFGLPAPIDILVEDHPDPAAADKSLALWPTEVLAAHRTGAPRAIQERLS